MARYKNACKKKYPSGNTGVIVLEKLNGTMRELHTEPCRCWPARPDVCCSGLDLPKAFYAADAAIAAFCQGIRLLVTTLPLIISLSLYINQIK